MNLRIVRRRMTNERIRRCMSVSVGISMLSAATLTAFALSIGVPAGTAARNLPP